MMFSWTAFSEPRNYLRLVKFTPFIGEAEISADIGLSVLRGLKV